MYQDYEHLVAAIEADEPEQILNLLEQNPELRNSTVASFGAEINLTSFAARQEKPAALRCLIATGIDLNDPARNPYVFTTIEIMDILYENGATVERDAPDYHPIQSACENDDPAQLKRLLDHGSDPNRVDHPL